MDADAKLLSPPWLASKLILGLHTFSSLLANGDEFRVKILMSWGVEKPLWQWNNLRRRAAPEKKKHAVRQQTQKISSPESPDSLGFGLLWSARAAHQQELPAQTLEIAGSIRHLYGRFR